MRVPRVTVECTLPNRTVSGHMAGLITPITAVFPCTSASPWRSGLNFEDLLRLLLLPKDGLAATAW